MGTVVSLPDAARKMLLCTEPPAATLHAAGLQPHNHLPTSQPESATTASLSPAKRFASSRNRLVQALSPRRDRRNSGGSGDATCADDVTVARGGGIMTSHTSPARSHHRRQHHQHQRSGGGQQQVSCGTLGVHHEASSALTPLHVATALPSSSAAASSSTNEFKFPNIAKKEENITPVLKQQCESSPSADLISELRRDIEHTGNELGNLPANIPRPGILTGVMSNDGGGPSSSPPLQQPPSSRGVASPPGSISGSKDDSSLPCGSTGGASGVSTQQSASTAAVPPATAHRNGQLAKQGSLTIVRRSSQKSARNQHQCLNSPPPCSAPSANVPPLPPAPDSPGSSSCPEDSVLDAVDLSADNLPPVDTPDACDKAALRLRCLLRQLHRGDVSVELLRRNLQYAARVLEAVYIDEAKRLADEDDELSEVQPDAVPHEVREWLASTFTRQLANQRRRADEKPKFRSVAHAIRAGIFVDRIYRRMSSAPLMQFPPEVARALKTLDEWTFDVFALNDAANSQPVKFLGYDLLNRYGIIHKFKVQPQTLENFLSRVEEGYCRYRNPYHNNLHAADVAQTVHYMLCQTGLMNWLSDLEIFATLVAAVVHDLEHTGTTNNFHVMAQSDTAVLYNDRAVLENHHASATFRLLREEENNILSHLSREEFREFRTLVIDMVLATDMSFHFQQLKNMRNLLTLAEPSVDKSKALSLVLHCCDISHPAKRWDEHHRWTSLLLEEFFLQGDKERELGLPFSPLCDRNNTLVAESQIGFIEFIVEPSMGVCSDMLDAILAPLHASSASSMSSGRQSATTSSISEEAESGEQEEGSSTPSVTSSPAPFVLRKPWITCLAANKKSWKEQAVKDAEARALQKKMEEEEEARRQAGEGASETSETPEVTVEDG